MLICTCFPHSCQYFRQFKSPLIYKINSVLLFCLIFDRNNFDAAFYFTIHWNELYFVVFWNDFFFHSFIVIICDSFGFFILFHFHHQELRLNVEAKKSYDIVNQFLVNAKSVPFFGECKIRFHFLHCPNLTSLKSLICFCSYGLIQWNKHLFIIGFISSIITIIWLGMRVLKRTITPLHLEGINWT